MQNNDYLDQLRHSAAHLLCAAVLDLYPKAKPTIGPSIENGFYYDFDFGKQKISEENLKKIEKKMEQLVRSWSSFEKQEVTPAQAKKKFTDNPYKTELIEEFSGEDKQLTFYKSGDFVDLCRGGHIENPSKELRHFKLLSIAGAYWRGSEKNQMLTRIYGTAWPTKDELEKYLWQLEEAKKRDHRKLGQELDLFTINSEMIGPGLAIWLPKGAVLKEELEKLGKEVEFKEGYQRVSTPHIAKEILFKTSGHLPYYAADMYPPMQMVEGNYYLKPMNCPHMYMAYKAKPHTYKEFPIRYAEFGTVYRNEDSGTLFGIMRVRGLTQNDAHIFCSEDQVIEELKRVMQMHAFYYDLFEIKDYYIELALPDLKNKKDKYFDDPKAWAKAVEMLRNAAKESGVNYIEKEGEAAFYGPKFDFNVKSAIGREFGASTNQLDFMAGERFKLTYTDSDGKEKIVPYIIHRAPLGSDERFIGFLIEHFGGAFPVWMAPVQVAVLPINDAVVEYAKQIEEKLKKEFIRVELDSRSETLQSKIRDAQLQKVPYMLIIGKREEENKTISVRLRSGEDLGGVSLDEFLGRIKANIEARSGL